MDYLTLKKVQMLVNLCQSLEQSGRIDDLQNNLFHLYQYFNKPGGGEYIINYPEKENLSICFSFMLHYDWMHDSDIREVWAENGFYCIIEYIFSHLNDPDFGNQGHGEALILLFMLLCVGRDSLKPKIQDIINRSMSIILNPNFHEDDYLFGAQNVINQFAYLSVNGIRALLGEKSIPVMFQITKRYNGIAFFKETIENKEIEKYSADSIWEKAVFIKNVIGSILEDM